MTNEGHALVETIICLELLSVLLFGSALLRHIFSARAAALSVVAAGSELAGHPDLSDDQRSDLLTAAAQRIFSCPFCEVTVRSERYLDSPAARFYDLLRTRVRVRLGHARLRALLGIPDTLEESAVVGKEPGHAF